MAVIDPWTVDARWFDKTRVEPFDSQPMHKRVRQTFGDELATRRLILRVHGRGTLHNFILNFHGKANRY